MYSKKIHIKSFEELCFNLKEIMHMYRQTKLKTQNSIHFNKLIICHLKLYVKSQKWTNIQGANG